MALKGLSIFAKETVVDLRHFFLAPTLTDSYPLECIYASLTQVRNTNQKHKYMKLGLESWIV